MSKQDLTYYDHDEQGESRQLPVKYANDQRPVELQPSDYDRGIDAAIVELSGFKEKGYRVMDVQTAIDILKTLKTIKPVPVK
jgi:hypothetical protein